MFCHAVKRDTSLQYNRIQEIDEKALIFLRAGHTWFRAKLGVSPGDPWAAPKPVATSTPTSASPVSKQLLQYPPKFLIGSERSGWKTEVGYVMATGNLEDTQISLSGIVTPKESEFHWFVSYSRRECSGGVWTASKVIILKFSHFRSGNLHNKLTGCRLLTLIAQ